ASSCCNHSLRQQYKAASLKTRLFSVAEENVKFKVPPASKGFNKALNILSEQGYLPGAGLNKGT
ncbi:hypothetical protein HGM15179_005982, partial [Zosterops borbonicus]